MNTSATLRTTANSQPALPQHDSVLRQCIIALVAFLTLVDLFATQAILPALVKHYGVSRAAMGFAVNASTIGMAIAALAVALFGHRIDRRLGTLTSLVVLAIPTALLAVAPDLASFTALRIVQGLCMSTAFALTLSYLAEHCSGAQAAGAFAAYITGNVASNLFGRLLSASLADHFGLANNFFVFAALNLAGGVLVFFALMQSTPMPMMRDRASTIFTTLAQQWRTRALRVSFAIGFLILFVFIGTFTYVNFVLVRAPLSLSQMALGAVYLVFAPAIFTTPLAGRAAKRWGTRKAFWGALLVAGAGVPLLLAPHLVAVVIGLACIGAGTFFAQATTTGFVGRAAGGDPGSASGMYLACYFAGGLVGAAVLGQLFDRFGWTACVTAIGAALLLAAWLARDLDLMNATEVSQ